MSSNPHRLPRAVHPERYDIVLEPDLPAATFRGTVDIALVVDEPADELVCNAADLVLERGHADGRRHGRRRSTWTHDDEYERVSFALPEPLPAGTERAAVDRASPAR